jgi:hypothetical protein
VEVDELGGEHGSLLNAQIRAHAKIFTLFLLAQKFGLKEY